MIGNSPNRANARAAPVCVMALALCAGIWLSGAASHAFERLVMRAAAGFLVFGPDIAVPAFDPWKHGPRPRDR